jgi:two-component system, NtrC family, C4-dicarboxylate transport sensor histidine kinase DctB
MPKTRSSLVWLPAAVLVVAVAGWIGSLIGGRYELRQQAQQLRVDAALRRELLRSEIERHRLLPTTLARNPQLAVAVDARTLPAERARVVRLLNDDFEQLARADGAATLYLVDADGMTLAASNHRSTNTFIGQDYSFRSYFRDAMKTGVGELFAQGTVSGIPGLYLAQRLREGGGVVVTKVEFPQLEETWRRSGEETLVTNKDGIVLLTSAPTKRFSKYDSSPAVQGGWISAPLPALYQDWKLVLRRDISARVLASRLIGASIGGLLGLLVFTMRYLVVESRRRRAVQRAELERLVLQRTAELKDSNQRLLQEIEERSRSEAIAQKLRENLTQANRLAILGQISAGVAHEINQPTAAISTYVDNARKLFMRGDSNAGLTALESIASLTERIGLITGELREFSRRSPGARERLPVRDAIDGSLLLLEQSLKLRHIQVKRPKAPEPELAFANRTRLEQILVNLVQNAMDALAGSTDPLIKIETGAAGGLVWIKVSDNGPGIPVERRGELFSPFSSSKPMGLGLGLVISRDIASDLGGSLEFDPDSDGAAFILRIPALKQ